MVSMAWKISHLLLYIHKYTEDYLQSRVPRVQGRGWEVGGARILYGGALKARCYLGILYPGINSTNKIKTTILQRTKQRISRYISSEHKPFKTILIVSLRGTLKTCVEFQFQACSSNWQMLNWLTALSLRCRWQHERILSWQSDDAQNDKFNLNLI